MSIPFLGAAEPSLLARRGLGLLLATAITLCPLFPAAAQGPLAKVAQGDTKEAPAEQGTTPDPDPDYSKPMGPDDPFNRGTPRGSVFGFIVAANAGDYTRAAEFLDLRRLPDGKLEGPELAKELKVVLDRTFWVDFEQLSDTHEGQVEDGLPAWRDRLARIETQKGPVDLLLQRMPRAEDSVRIWKVSSVTVAQIPELFDEYGYGPLADYLPPFFFEFQLFEFQLWQLIGLAILLFFAWFFAWAVARVVIRLLHPLYMRKGEELDERVIKLVQGPVRLALAVAIVRLGHMPLSLSVPTRETLSGAEQILIIVAFTWLVMRLVDLFTLKIRQRLIRRGQLGALPVLAPSQTTAKVIVVTVAGIALLDNLGFNITALIAGLGVGGIAIALAAQKTVENLFGGATLFADQPIRVGDFCRFGEKVGTVEEIGLRSTRIRTLDRTIVTVPNAEFSSMQIENFAKRDQIRIHTVLGLRYETTPEQLRFVLARLREMLLAHPKVSPDPARARFVAFGAYSLDLELYAYAYTTEWDEFLTIREDIFLRIMDIVAEAGSGFAFPSQTTYIGKDNGLDTQAAQHAEDHVERWRSTGDLPFPHLPNARREEIEDKLDWPPEGSPGGAPRVGRRPGGGADEEV